MPLRLDTGAKSFASDFAALLSAKREMEADVDAVVAQILADVKARGDAAVIDHTARFDRLKLTPSTMRVPAKDVAAAASSCAPETLAALRLAAERIEAYHRRQVPEDFSFTDAAGVRLGSRWRPIATVGIYVPGGTAAYPSSVLMNAVPAKVAGVERLVMVVPSPDGVLNPLVLAAASLAGVDEVYRIGGAQAVGALAYGTATIAAVDKIVGPGNA
jgi:histidinol dehydrogenase